jgi:hypothetical protein
LESKRTNVRISSCTTATVARRKHPPITGVEAREFKVSWPFLAKRLPKCQRFSLERNKLQLGDDVFTEVFDVADIKEAKSLLDILNA